MTTATELADKIRLAYIDDELLMVRGMKCEELEALRAELRRIPDMEQRLADAEKRALTDADIDVVRAACGCLCELPRYPNVLSELRALVTRLRPPKVEWHDVGDGSIATCNGWTLAVYPGSEQGDFMWDCGCKTGGGGCSVEDTIPAAKSAAEAWAREHPVEVKP